MFDQVGPDMLIYRDEVLGPLLVVLRADAFEPGLGFIHRNVYGNGAAIFTAFGVTTSEFQSDVSARMVGVNVPIPVPMVYYSFAGWKQSLRRDVHAYGREAIVFCTRVNAVVSRWSAHASRSACPSYVFPTVS